MKDLNKLKEEAFKEFNNIHMSELYTRRQCFDNGWDACVKAMEKANKKKVFLWDDRIQEFEQEVVKNAIIITGCTNNHVSEFISYWTEPNKSGTQMKFEMEKTWDTKRRLQTWIKRDKKFNPKDTVGGEKKQTVWKGNYMDTFNRS